MSLNLSKPVSGLPDKEDVYGIYMAGLLLDICLEKG